MDVHRAINTLLLVVVIVLLALIGCYHKRNQEYSASRMDTLVSVYRRLSDGKSAQSGVSIIERPVFLGDLFGAKANKIYKQMLDSIPEIVRRELKTSGDLKNVTEISNTYITLDGDSAVYRNSTGVALKYAVVRPVNGDSSILILHPQNIKVIGVRAEPDSRKPEEISVYFSAINLTTGDTLVVNGSTTYSFARKTTIWSIRPYLYAGAEIMSYKPFIEVGFTPLVLKRPKVDYTIGRTRAIYRFTEKPRFDVGVSLGFK